MEENNSLSETKQQVSDSVDETIKSDNMVSYDSHRTLLGEKKKLQAERNELRQWKEEQELTALEAKGKDKEVIAALREKLKESDEKFQSTTKKVAFDKFAGQAREVAVELGCTDVESLMLYMNKERMASIQTDDRLNANKDDLKRVIEEIKMQKNNLFSGNNINHTPVTMAGFKKEEPKTINEMSKDELLAQIRL